MMLNKPSDLLNIDNIQFEPRFECPYYVNYGKGSLWNDVHKDINDKRIKIDSKRIDDFMKRWKGLKRNGQS